VVTKAADKAAGEALNLFSPATRSWFTGAFAAPTSAQVGAWKAAHAGEHALVIAPTGSGKTLAAFLWALDRLASEPPPADPLTRCRVLYISPLKALAVDVRRNLRAPLVGIARAAHRLGLTAPDISVGMRTGDTTPSERRAFTKTPPDILVTTPESLFLLLTSSARESLRGIETVILDEVHAVASGKRGAHLAVSLERLDALLPQPAQRIGLSATVRPVEEISAFLGGGRTVRVVHPKHEKTIEVRVEVPVEDMSTLDSTTEKGSPAQIFPSEGGIGTAEEITGSPIQRPSIWPSVENRVLELIRAHRSTIVFANSRRLAERLTARLNELAVEQSILSPDQRFPAEAIGQSGLTTGVDARVAKAHHGSMSREQRTQAEEELKSGQLPCVVATSSLELGIDMGAVDLVVQIEAPPTVASGLQRVGRAGHQVGGISRGVMFPKFRGDLVSCAVVAERMVAGAIEAVRYLRNPLDVLAQHIVAMVAMEPWTVEELGTVLRRAAPFSALPEDALLAVLDMLSGRYPSEEFGELRPRITWNRTTGELRGRPGAQRLAVTSGGTIPDRGLFTVTTPGEEITSSEGEKPAAKPKPGRRVGELDEEMVYESRVGDTILLGTSSWRIIDITHDRVVVVPAPGEPARMPFWKGDAPGRPLELGRALGALVRELSTMDKEKARTRAKSAGLDDRACDNLLSYLAEQQAATRYVPHDRAVVVERFRDELGDWRVVVHSPFGARVNAPWALAIAARLREKRGVDAKVAHSDDGIVLRLPDALDADGAEVVLDADDVLFSPEEVEPLVVAEVGGSALFAARFRECAARSLLLPRRNPGRRSPLWQQRQRAAQLMSVASKYERFPVVLEAMRECLQDVYDVAGFRQLMSEIEKRRIRVVEVETPSPSPFARSLLFGYVGMFLYETDSPLAERRAAALALDSTLLAELLGTEAIRELLDPDAVSEVERSLQRLDPDRGVRDVEDTADLLRFLGDLSVEEAILRSAKLEWLEELEASRRVIRVRIAGEERFLSIEDAGKVRDALGVALPMGIPEAFTEPVNDPLGDLLTRYARVHGPFTATQAGRRWGLGSAVLTVVLDHLTAEGRLVRGELSPVGRHEQENHEERHQLVSETHISEAPATIEMEYCDSSVLRRIKRVSLAKLRSEVEPVEPAALGRFLPLWHGIGSRPRIRSAPTADDVLAVVEQLAGAPLPASAVESLVLSSRIPGYHPALLDELTIAGEVLWSGCGTLSGSDGWLTLVPTDMADLLLPDPETSLPLNPLHEAVLSTLEGGALFFRELMDRISSTSETRPQEAEVSNALWDLAWAGRVTGDTLGPLRALVSGKGATHKPRQPSPRGRYARMRASRIATHGANTRNGPPTVAGRWALTPSREADPTRRAAARTEAFLERHGVLTRGALETERVTGGFSGIYKVLRGMEDSGQVIRGYVVEGLGGAQFAARGAVDQLRELSDTSRTRRKQASPGLALAATDPAQPYGAALPWPAPLGDTKHRPARKAGALTVLVGGLPVLYLERGGRSLLSFTSEGETLAIAARALSQLVHDGQLNQLTVLRADGEFALNSTLSEIFQEVGFRATPKGLRLRA
jgi:ATP-dependent Lhr-like helicase